MEKIHNFLRPDPLDLLLEVSAGRVRSGGRWFCCVEIKYGMSDIK
jgi:hypothetical protein